MHLLSSERKSAYFDLLDRIQNPIFIKCSEANLIYCNDAFALALASNKNQLIGKCLCDIARTCYHNGPCKLAYMKAIRESTRITFKHSFIDDSSLIHAVYGIPMTIDFLHHSQSLVGVLEAIHHSDTDTPSLSRKEIQVLQLLSLGHSVKSISQALNISPHTTAGYMKSLYIKLNVRSKITAINEGRRLALIN